MTPLLPTVAFGAPDVPATPQSLSEACARLAAGREALRGRSTGAIAAGIAHTVQRWILGPDAHFAVDVATIAAESGLPSAMIAWSLQDLARRLNPASLASLVEAELGSREPFGPARNYPGLPCQRIATPPSLLHTVLAESVPPVGIEAVVLGLLARAPHLVKTSSREQCTTRAFVRALGRYAPELAPHVVVASWDGATDGAHGQALLSQASVVVVYGSDATVDHIRSQCRFPTRCIGYGHRLSFTVLGPADPGQHRSAVAELATSVAMDAVAYEQRGCMSPQVVFVAQQAPFTTAELAHALCSVGLPQAHAELRREALPIGQIGSLQAARALAEFGGASATLVPEGLVITHPTLVLPARTQAGVVHVVPFGDTSSLAAHLAPLANAISTVGLWWTAPDRDAVLGLLADLGARRICRPGRMQRPVWVRDHDGRPRLGDWIEWTDIEPA